MKITLVTRHYPPSRNINGILANQMAGYLVRDSNAEVTVFCIGMDAEGNLSSENPVGKVVAIPQKFSNGSKVGKLLNMLADGYLLIRAAKKQPSDLVICTSSPPLLPMWASMLFGKRRKWAFWSLDLFPEGFAAAGTIKKTSFVYRFLMRRTYKNPPQLLIALGEHQARHIQAYYPSPVPQLILPAGVSLEEQAEKLAGNKPSWFRPDAITLGYFGNVGQAHNPDFIKKMIEASAGRSRFVLSVYGIHAAELKAFASAFEHVEVVENGIAPEHLPFIDVHLVTLRTSWTHAAVPSKAVTAVSNGRPVLFCGSEDSDNWQMFRNAGWLVHEDERMDEDIERFFANAGRAEIERKAAQTGELVADLKRQVLDVYSKLGSGSY